MRPGKRARGTVAVIAMMCLVIFGLLSAGMAAMSMSSVQLTKNNRSYQNALLSAESGLDYLKFVLSDPGQTIPSNVADADLLDELAARLVTYYQGTTTTVDLQNNTIYLPRQSDPAIATGNARFHMQIRPLADPATGKFQLAAQVIGLDQPSGITHTIKATFDPHGGGATAFDYGVYTQGGICQSGNGSVIGDPRYARTMSVLPSGIAYNMSAGVQISGAAFTAAVPVSGTNVKTSGSVTVNGLTLGSTDFFTNGFKQADPPPLPQFDPTVFKSLVPLTTWSGDNSSTIVRNAIIPANSQGLSNKTLQGLIYIESPNQIQFSGCTINAVIVFAPKAASTTVDKLTLSSTAAFGPIPSSTPFDPVRKVTAGYAILAPTATVNASGSMGNSTSPIGSIICDRLQFSGGCEVNIHNGSIIVFDKTPATSGAAAACNLSGASAIRFTRDDNFGPPQYGFTNTGARKFLLDPASYAEGY